MPDEMTKPMLPAAEKFVEEMRKVFADGVPAPDRWDCCRELLKNLIADSEIISHAKNTSSFYSS